MTFDLLSVCPPQRCQCVLQQAAHRSRRRTVFSSVSCPTWAVRGWRPLAASPRPWEPWPRCGQRVPSQFPSPSMCPMYPRAASGQSYRDYTMGSVCVCVWSLWVERSNSVMFRPLCSTCVRSVIYAPIFYTTAVYIWMCSIFWALWHFSWNNIDLN